MFCTMPFLSRETILKVVHPEWFPNDRPSADSACLILLKMYTENTNKMLVEAIIAEGTLGHEKINNIHRPECSWQMTADCQLEVYPPPLYKATHQNIFTQHLYLFKNVCPSQSSPVNPNQLDLIVWPAGSQQNVLVILFESADLKMH